jgi:prepilin-type processing-associated H-X9-DG protein/prepilin-type N-terminal cleavage/methylation domain-containing protein
MVMRHSSPDHLFKRNFPGAFTLLELLVVIAIIGIMAALLLPVLSRAKDKARSTECLNNLKQLQICSHLYAGDNGDFLPPNDSLVTPDGTPNGTSIVSGQSWCPDHPQTDLNTTNLERGVLFQYNRSVAIYHCPADNAIVQTTNGQPLLLLRDRSYNMSQSVNGYSAYLDNIVDYDEVGHIPAFSRLAQIQTPGPSDLFVFIDELPATEYDASFGMPPKGSSFFQQWQNCWFDMPADRHNQGGNLSFADGHVEHWQWKAPKVFTGFGQAVTAAEMPDYARLQNAMLQPATD